MNEPVSNNSTNSTTTTSDLDTWEKIPCVQYGFPDDKGPARAPKLRTIFEPIPDDAATASPVYILTRDQYERQQRLESGYEVKGATSIATELQNECEADDRVLYPVHIESDVYHEEGPAILIDWFREFVEDYLNAPFHTCRLYFSGNRSIHAHVPRFVSGEDQRESLRELAETFCEETEAELDCGLYYAKRLFRLPSVKHAKTGLRKVEIEPEWNHNRIFREVNEAALEIPESYEAVLRQVFFQPSLVKDTAQPTLSTPDALFRVLDSEKTVLKFESNTSDIETPLIEQEVCPGDPAAVPEWTQYNAKEFSPYALASGNKRSVAVVKVKGTPFARKDVTGGNTSRPVHALVPAYFYGARGCAGEGFIKDHEHAPLQLSKPDYKKWEKRGFRPGDYVVIIGGKSNRSRIFGVDSWQATVAGHVLTGEGASRRAALDYLENEGYDVGKAGNSKNAVLSKTARTQEGSGRNSSRYSGAILPMRSPMTPAAQLQQRAEQDGIETLSHAERGRVACRVLLWGWEPAWAWFKDQYGSAFKPDVTWGEFKNIVEAYPEYDPLKVPPKPR